MAERPVSIQVNPEGGRCAGTGSHGRCQLRGAVGRAGADGGRWRCPWHHEVHEFGLFPSRANFELYLDDREMMGDPTWKSRTRDAWWSLVQGTPGLGGWDYRRGNEEEIQPAAPNLEVPGY